MYQGLDPRTRPLRWLLFGAAVTIVLLGTGGTALDTATVWLRDEYERVPWYLTRTTALLSYLALSASVLYGLLLSTKLLDRIAHRAVSFTLHQDLGSIGLALALVHAAVLMIDRSVPYSPTELLVPFSGMYRPVWVGIGQLAMGATILVVASFYLRKRTGQKTWRRIHHLSFLVFLGATIHGIMAGTDSGASWAALGYLMAITLVAFLLTYRVLLAATERLVGPRRPTPRPDPGLERSVSSGATASAPDPG
jgi:DMSO/TMAO reductase YedYZ heme-binding membrane subunit